VSEPTIVPGSHVDEPVKDETPPEPQVVTAEPVTPEPAPAPDPGNSPPENWTEPLSEEDQQEARDAAASTEESRPKTLAELDAEYVADGHLDDLTDRERHERIEAVRVAQHEQAQEYSKPAENTETSSES